MSDKLNKDLCIQFAVLWGMELADNRGNEKTLKELQGWDSEELSTLFEAWSDEYLKGNYDDTVDFFNNKIKEVTEPLSGLSTFYENETDIARLGEEIKFWSNALGELHHHGEYDISEDELPDELKRAYNDLYYENGGNLCYLVETKKGYGVALINEYDSYTAKEVAKSSMKELFGAVIKDAHEISKYNEFKDAQIIASEGSGIGGCHELIVVLPADMPDMDYNKAVSLLDELAYRSAWEMGNDGNGLKSLDGKIVSTEKNITIDASIAREERGERR